ncbi:MULTISPECIES: peptidoglycan DD-metalloendopeptidase family protein [Vibrio]|uniref:Murein hydrolase activator NlpD n=1 Tax=Vibrio halioticoli NBRC 102217 TaxID=1219072 RepID=V5FG23_9VIBR|nr:MULTISPECIES: peptidoglycan DD-metalloendopeptidase family protein [Vibrio]MPW34953.1 peptidoglycan DD-metalloendopeptidase family protein [Vibrio sp. B1Z05]GAD90698.1 murein hydrolase activator NlpD [Vibrio halioticoli NBRC 102217]
MERLLRLVIAALMIVSLVGCAPSGQTSNHRGYKQADRGSYRGSYYTVKKGDTLYYIAYVTDRNVNGLIRFNNLKAPYTLRIGQRIRLWYPETPAYTSSKSIAVASAPTSHTHKTSSTMQKSAHAKVDKHSTKEYVSSKQGVNSAVTSTASSNQKIASWKWPTKGRVINKFSSGETGNKGIDIAGQRGQAVISTAKGSVVYSGNALRGYGNLIIVKHNDNYLSAYAHNDKLLVHEGQQVTAGQKIATMGSSGTNGVKLHFEIRYQGKSVNPERYLP